MQMFDLCMHVCRFFMIYGMYGNHSLTVSRLEHWSGSCHISGYIAITSLSFIYIYGRGAFILLYCNPHIHIRTHTIRGVFLTNGIFFHLNVLNLVK